MKISYFIIAIFCLSFGSSFALANPAKIFFSNSDGKKNGAIKTIQIEPKVNGERLIKIILYQNINGQEREYSYEEVTLDKSGETQKWIFKNAQLEISAQKNQHKVEVRSIENGVQTVKNFTLSAPWIQSYFHGIEDFAFSSKDKVKFHAFGTESHAKLKMGDFVASKEKNDENLVEVMVTFDDWKSAFWKGRVWFNKDQKKLIRYYEDKTWGNWQVR